jgi:hypothetical protein
LFERLLCRRGRCRPQNDIIATANLGDARPIGTDADRGFWPVAPLD